ncbi:nucleotidyltransferase domain protein [bacterium BMS3Abin10]|nr:nucleotidyltransferase domain protein [bacterium BMS3Abin10]
MKFHNFLNDILSSRVKLDILRAFYKHRTKEFTERELADYIKRCQSPVNYAIKDLVSSNILWMKVIGRANVYTLNPESYFVKNCLLVFEAEKGILANLIRLIKKDLKNTLSVILYGSLVNGKEKPESDIDLLIVCRNKKATEKKIISLQDKVSKVFGNAIVPHILTEDELNRKKNKPFIKNALKKGIRVMGKL